MGNKYLQEVYFILFKIGLKGMNYDRGHIPELSGERWVLKFLQKKTQNSPLVIFDVGANNGQYSKLVIETIKKPFKLYAFEPQKKSFSEIIKIANSDSFKVYNIGMGEKNEKLTLYYNQEGSGFASLYKAVHKNYNIKLDLEEEITLATVDDFCEKNKINQIDLLKLDVEGHELKVIKGAKKTIQSGKIKNIQFEFGLASVESRIFIKDFFEILSGYEIYRVLQNGIKKIHYNEYFEIFLTTNYLAVLKEN